MRAKLRPYGLVMLALLIGLAAMPVACDRKPARTPLRVFVADSLHRPLVEVSRAFESENPGVEVVLVPSGSVMAARRIVEANDAADVLLVADYLVIEELMRPTHADWYICFATNEVVIAYTEASKYSAELTAENWYEVLSRPEVNIGAANPHYDPCGYWAELCWRLADRHYSLPAGAEPISARMIRQCGSPEQRRSDAQELLQILETAGGIDYVFAYRSQAMQHRLPHLRLPPQISLGDAGQADLYRSVHISLPGKAKDSVIEKRGEPIVYAMTLPKNGRQAEIATRYAAFLLGQAGRKILADQYVLMADEPWTYDLANVPPGLRAGLREQRPAASAPGDSDGG